jgi:pimeloyl-ACP methyl ester carboxylesterase
MHCNKYSSSEHAYARCIHQSRPITWSIVVQLLHIQLCILLPLQLNAQTKQFIPNAQALNILTFIPASASTTPTYTIKSIRLHKLVSMIQSNTMPSTCKLRINNTDKQVFVHKGIALNPQQHDTVFISSRGYAKRDTMLAHDELELVKKGGGAIAAHVLFKNNLVDNAPCITFDYPDDRAYFNFGQEIDVACLQKVWDSTIAAHPQVRIVGVGDCRGAKALLALATRHPKNLVALVLISPFVTTKDMIQQLAKNYLTWLPKSDKLLHTFFKCYFPSYDALQDTLLHQVHLIDPTIPIFIGQRKNDYLASDKSIHMLINRLRTAGNNNVHLCMVSDNKATHSRIAPIAKLQQEVNQFLADYQLPHNELLAQKIPRH